jgi:hypothetical protein
MRKIITDVESETLLPTKRCDCHYWTHETGKISQVNGPTAVFFSRAPMPPWHFEVSLHHLASRHFAVDKQIPWLHIPDMKEQDKLKNLP